MATQKFEGKGRMKRSLQASTPVLLRVQNYPKASLRDGDSEEVTETDSEPEYSTSQSDGESQDENDGFDLSDDENFEDFYHGGKRRGRGTGGKGGRKNLGEFTMPVDDMEGEATYASSAIAGMFGNVGDNDDQEELEQEAAEASGAVESQRKKRLEILLSKTDKIVNRLNVVMKESMSNVMKAAIEANKADMDMKREMEEEEEQRKLAIEKGEDENKGPSPVKTRNKTAAAAAAAAAAVAMTGDSQCDQKNAEDKVFLSEEKEVDKVERIEKKFLNSGNLRDYQSGGVEWLGALHEQGLNGILADEMGLGKTLQVLTFLYELHERHRLWGPHLVVMPMSVLSSWKAEVQRFLPNTFDVYVHHGSKDMRAEEFLNWQRRMVATRKARIAAMASASTTTLGSVLKSALSPASGDKGKDKESQPSSPRGPQSICICLTTYDIALKDQALLQRFGRSACRWGYLVVDEAHRLKNRSSLLFEALTKVRASRRLLLSGTPLQNNLGELWSLLSFILPEVFTDIQHFIDWFNRPFEQDSDQENESNAAPRQGKGKNKLKQQRKSFKGQKASLAMQMRVQSSVQDTLSEEERSLIVNSLHRIMKPFLLRRLKRDVMTEVPQKVERTIICPRSVLQKSLYEVIRSSVETSEGDPKSKGANSKWRSPTDHLKPAKADLLMRQARRNKIADLDGDNPSGGDSEDLDEDEALFEALEDHASRIFSSGVSFNNVLMHLRKLCNHPYLLLEDMCTIPDDLYHRYLVSASGKMCVLERLVQRLLPQGHKIIVFSQFTSTMDILQGFFQNLGINAFRLDGSTPRETRESDIADFMGPDPDGYIAGAADGGSSIGRVPVYLLSTRAGGVGINLQSADTVIFFDSDWNPQQDLQAMSRAHRLGQKETVLVLRLVTCGEASDDGYYYPSAEQRILKAAAHKLAAERIVLADGEFDMGTSGGGAPGKAARALQKENKQLTEALVQDGGIMALFAKEDDAGLDSRTIAVAATDDSAQDDRVSSGDNLAVSPAAAASVRARSEGMRSLDASYLLEMCSREGLVHRSSSTSLETSLASSSAASSLRASPETDRAADSSTDNSRVMVEVDLSAAVDPSERGVTIAEAKAVTYTPLLKELNYDQVRDWAPWLGVPPAFKERVLEEKKRREQEKKAEQERLRREQQELKARLKEERAAKSASLHKQAVAARAESGGSTSKIKHGEVSGRQTEAAAKDGAKSVRGWKRKLGRKVSSPNLNEDKLWHGALAAAEEAETDAASSPGQVKRGRKSRTLVPTPVVLDEEDICVLCGEAWVSADLIKMSDEHAPSDAKAGMLMTDREREQVMLLCDGCSGSYHLVCVGCYRVPEGDWYCRFCEVVRSAHSDDV